MLLAEIASGRRYDRAFGDNDLPSRLNRLADIVLAHEVERTLVWCRSRRLTPGLTRGRTGSLTASLTLVAASGEELVDPA